MENTLKQNRPREAIKELLVWTYRTSQLRKDYGREQADVIINFKRINST